MSACHLNWVMDWPLEALQGELSHYVEKHHILDESPAQMRFVILIPNPFSSSFWNAID